MEERNGGSKWRGQFSSQPYSVEDLREENEAVDLSNLHNVKRYSGKLKKKNKKRHVLSHRNAQRVGQLSSSLVQFYFAPLETKLSASCQWLLEKSYELMGLDMRSLALWRICLAITSLCDLWDRYGIMTKSHFLKTLILCTEGFRTSTLTIRHWECSQRLCCFNTFGMKSTSPPSVLFNRRPRLPQMFIYASVLCFHLMGGTWQFEAVLFAVHALICMMMLVGYRTRLATFLNWLLTSSLQVHLRVIIATTKVEHIIRVLSTNLFPNRGETLLCCTEEMTTWDWCFSVPCFFHLDIATPLITHSSITMITPVCSCLELSTLPFSTILTHTSTLIFLFNLEDNNAILCKLLKARANHLAENCIVSTYHHIYLLSMCANIKGNKGFDSQLPGWIWGLKSPREKFPSLLISPSNALYILQLAMVYTSSVYYKVAP